MREKKGQRKKILNQQQTEEIQQSFVFATLSIVLTIIHIRIRHQFRRVNR